MHFCKPAGASLRAQPESAERRSARRETNHPEISANRISSWAVVSCCPREVAVPRPTLVEFVTDAGLLNPGTSPCPPTLLQASDGLPPDAEEREMLFACTGRGTYVAGRSFSEVTVVAGARAGKDSRIAPP